MSYNTPPPPTHSPVAVRLSVLQRVAVCCSVLQSYTGEKRSVIRHLFPPIHSHVAVCCSVLRPVAVCCSMLQCVAVCCIYCSLLQSCRGEKRSIIRHLFPVLKACPNFSKVSSILIGYSKSTSELTFENSSLSWAQGKDGKNSQKSAR